MYFYNGRDESRSKLDPLFIYDDFFEETGGESGTKLIL
jgi:hypothetical protein